MADGIDVTSYGYHAPEADKFRYWRQHQTIRPLSKPCHQQSACDSEVKRNTPGDTPMITLLDQSIKPHERA